MRQSSSFNLGAKGTGEKFSKRIAGAPAGKAIPKDRSADWVVQDKTTAEQAVTYRLSGDYNALHIGLLSPKLLTSKFLILESNGIRSQDRASSWIWGSDSARVVDIWVRRSGCGVCRWWR